MDYILLIPAGVSYIVMARWRTVGLWAVAGAVLSFAILDLPSIGLYLLPVSLAIIVTLVRRSRGRVFPDILGLIEGGAAILLWGAFISHGVPRCTPQGISGGRLYSGEISTSGCVRIDSQWWLVSGVVIAVGGLVVYVTSRGVMQRG